MPPVAALLVAALLTPIVSPFAPLEKSGQGIQLPLSQGFSQPTHFNGYVIQPTGCKSGPEMPQTGYDNPDRTQPEVGPALI